MAKKNKLEKKNQLEECARYILDTGAGWTSFTRWAKDKYNIGGARANNLWNETWDVLNETFSDSIDTAVNSTVVELESQKQQALDEGDRRLAFDITKYINKIKGGEIERIRMDANIDYSFKYEWGDMLEAPDEDENDD